MSLRGERRAKAEKRGLFVCQTSRTHGWTPAMHWVVRGPEGLAEVSEWLGEWSACDVGIYAPLVVSKRFNSPSEAFAWARERVSSKGEMGKS